MKSKLLVLFTVALAVMLCFAACGNNDSTDETKNVTSIEIVSGSYPAEINIGQTPDFSNIKVKVNFEDGTSKEVGYSDVTISALDTTTAGKKTVTVTYSGAIAKFDVTVIDPDANATVTSIKVVPGSVDSAYYIGQTPDMSRLQVEATYSNGKVGLLSAEEYTYSAIDTSAAGEQTFTVTYTADNTITDSVTVTIIPISSINVVTGSVKNKINVGETLDTSLIQVLVEYANGESVILGAADLTLGTVDSATYGKKEFSITYKGVTIQYPVEVVGPVSLTVNKGSYAESVKVFGAFDTSAITAYITYSDETKVTLEAKDLTIGSIDTAIVGKQALKVSYNGLETDVEVTVVGVESITVVDNTVKKEIFKGDTLDLSNIIVNVQYTDTTTESIAYEALTLGKINENVAGEQKLTVLYLDKSIEYTIKVCDIVAIRVEGINNVVPAGEKIDISEMKVYGVYNDSAETEIELTDGTITTNIDDIDINTTDDKMLVVSYNGSYGEFTVNYPIYATAPEFVGIEIRNYDKTIGLGGVYNKGSVVVYALYGNDTDKKITSYNITDVATGAAGEVTFTVTYTENDVTKSAEAKVQVLPIDKLEVSGIPTKVNKGETLDTTSVKVVVTFSDGSTRIVGANDVTISTPDTASGGDKELTVTYLGSSAKFAYHVKAVSGISIFSGIADTLRNGYAVDYSNLVLYIDYTDGTHEQKKASELAGVTFGGTGVDATSFSVTYEGFTATKTLKLINIVSISALNNTVPASVLQGATLSYESIKLTVVYDNGEVYLVGIEDANLTITPAEFDTVTPGTKSLTFTYFGQTTSVNILVKGVQSVEVIGGILTTVNVGQKLDTSDILVRIMYSDGTYFYADINSPYLEIGNIDTSSEGTKTLVIKYQGVEGKINIEVVSVKIEGLIFGALLPDELVARESYKKNFKDSSSAYRVGDDNPYYFYLNVVQLDENDNIVDVDGKTIPTAAKVYLVENGSETELTGDALTNMVEFNSAMNSYDFTDAAVGKTFRLEIRPADKNSYVDEKSVTKSHTVTVVDGYNIYEAWELNIITNVKHDVHGNFGEPLDQSEVVKSFLAKRGVTRPTNLAGVVLHCNLDIKVEDIPAEYLYEYTDANGVKQKGLYDQLGIFHLGLKVEQKTFDIYGNYYSIYSYNIPPVVPKGFANNDDEFSSSDLFKLKLNYATMPMSDFGDAGYNPNYDYAKDVMYPQIHASIVAGNEKPFENYIVNVRDIATRDNDPNSNDQSASERHMRGLNCYKVGENVTNMTNINIDAYMESVVVEHSNSTLNLEKVKFYNAWQTHLFLWNDNRYQTWMIGRDTPPPAYMQNLVVNINDSFIAKSGGPVILAQSNRTEVVGNHGLGVDVNVTGNSELYSYVTGQEAWFVAVGQTQLAAQIRAMNALITGPGGPHGYTSKDKIQGVETMNMIMVNMGTGINFGAPETYNGSFTNNGVTGLLMSRPDFNHPNGNSFKNNMLDMYTQATGGQAPIFQSSAGGTAYTDGATGCFGIETGAPGAPTANFYQGDYITLYYMGIGIMMEYYHAS